MPNFAVRHLPAGANLTTLLAIGFCAGSLNAAPAAQHSATTAAQTSAAVQVSADVQTPAAGQSPAAAQTPAAQSATAERPAAAEQRAAAAPPSTGTPAAARPSSAAPPSGATPAAAEPPATHAPESIPASPPAPMSGPQVIELLDQTVNWYRTLGIQQQTANEPSDLLILYDNRLTANQVIALAFDIARANAQILAKELVTQDSGATSSASQTLAQLQSKNDAQGAAAEGELESDQLQLKTAGLQQRSELQSRISQLHGELDLINARKNLLGTMASLSNENVSNGHSVNALKAQIEAMAVTLPSAAGANPASANGAATAAPSANSASASASSLATLAGGAGAAATRFGIWDLGANVVRLSEKIATIDTIDERTAALQAMFAKYRAPLIDQLKALSARGDALATEADSAGASAPDGVREQLDSLASQFKQISALFIPLSKEGVLLSQYRRNLVNWRDTVKSESRDALRTLGVRLGVLLILLAVAFTAAEMWRRAALHYVQDSRRRHQLLLLRRIALWSLVVVIVGFAFASELGSIVTFAGLITAGLAVAMQSVLVSIVGYFFLIGKYGIRVGDRVQIGEVTGEVIELGLVRMHLMELGGHGTLGPTGRVVAFANSIVFQVSSGLFKQIPGVNISWHEVTLPLPAGADCTSVKEKLLAAVTDALKEYHEEIVRQTQEIQRTTSSSSGGDPEPRVLLHYSATGVEAVVRYPVHSNHAAEIDERVSREALNAIASLTSGERPSPAT